MTINSAALLTAVSNKRIEDVKFALKTAIKNAQDVIQKNYKNEFNLIKWSSLVTNNADDIVSKAQLQTAIRAVNTIVKIGQVSCSIANFVASYLCDDKNISSQSKPQWLSILLDMIIIGCDCQLKNSQQLSIIDYLTYYQAKEIEMEKAQLLNTQTKQTQSNANETEKTQVKVIKAGQILAAYDKETKKFDIKKIFALKDIVLTDPQQQTVQYQSLAELTLPVGIFGANTNANKSDMSKSQVRDAESLPLLADNKSKTEAQSISSSKNNNDSAVNVRSCWPWW